MIIHGRTINGSKPVVGAKVKFTGMWRILSDVIAQTALDPNLLFIYPPLYADRPTHTSAGVPTPVNCEGGVLTLVEGDDKELTSPVQDGVKKIRLSNWKNLGVNDLLKVDVGDPYREEVLAVTKIEAGSSSDQPAWITLAWPLMLSHREGNIVQRFTSPWTGSGSVNRLKESAYRGHSTLLLTQLLGFTSKAYIRISSTTGTVPDEFHGVQSYEATSDADGFYQLPPLQRVGQVKLEATGNGKKADVSFQPDYSLYRNQLDLVLK